ncbi:hypothetical protein ABQF42_20660, partial [Xanthomonas campestris]|uniref:hypothetical protein n=1 Tax=Xanthomonas campestris TaxID=339 RepID=UPI0032E47E39
LRAMGRHRERLIARKRAPTSGMSFETATRNPSVRCNRKQPLRDQPQSMRACSIQKLQTFRNSFAHVLTMRPHPKPRKELPT